jgi:hypothetical protein
MTLSTTDVLLRLAGPANVANGTATAMTVPASHRYTIKHMALVNNTAGAITYKIGIGGVTDALLISPAVTLQAGEYANWDGLVTLAAAETLQTNATATGGTLTVSGLDQA